MAEEKQHEEPKGKRRKEAEAPADAPEAPASHAASDDSHGGVTDDQKAVDTADQGRARSGMFPEQMSGTADDDTPAQMSYGDDSAK
jgi:hypothetical protein